MTKRYLLLVLGALSVLSLSAQAETVNSETGLPARHLPTYTWRGAEQLNSKIAKEIAYLKTLQKGKHSYRYAYINKKNNNGGLSTYLVDLSTNRIIDTFPSLIGYAGMGCGKGQTRPGVEALTAVKGTGASRKKHWGNKWKLFDIERIEGVTRCGTDNQIVAHSNVNLSGKSIDDKVTSKSAGCFTVPPDRMAQMDKYAGNAYIYNVPQAKNN